MYVYQGIEIQKNMHANRRKNELAMTGHDIDDPLCFKFEGFAFASDDADCEKCKK